MSLTLPHTPNQLSEIEEFFLTQRGRPPDRRANTINNKIKELKYQGKINDDTLVNIVDGILESIETPQELIQFFPHILTANGYEMSFIEKKRGHHFLDKTLRLYLNKIKKPRVAAKNIFKKIKWEPSRKYVTNFIDDLSFLDFNLLKICSIQLDEYFDQEKIWTQAAKQSNKKVLRWMYHTYKILPPEEHIKNILVDMLTEIQWMQDNEKEKTKIESLQKECVELLPINKEFQHSTIKYKKMDKAFEHFFEGNIDICWFYEKIGEMRLSILWNEQKMKNVLIKCYQDTESSPLTKPALKISKI